MPANNVGVNIASTQLAAINSATVVGVTQTVLQASVVRKGKVGSAVIDNKSTVKKGKAVNHTTVTLSFSTN